MQACFLSMICKNSFLSNMKTLISYSLVFPWWAVAHILGVEAPLPCLDVPGRPGSTVEVHPGIRAASLGTPSQLLVEEQRAPQSPHQRVLASRSGFHQTCSASEKITTCRDHITGLLVIAELSIGQWQWQWLVFDPKHETSWTIGQVYFLISSQKWLPIKTKER